MRPMKLEKWFARSNLTQAQFAELSGLSQPTVSRLLDESKERSVLPTWETIRKIELATGGAVTALDFFQTVLEQQAAE